MKRVVKELRDLILAVFWLLFVRLLVIGDAWYTRVNRKKED